MAEHCSIRKLTWLRREQRSVHYIEQLEKWVPFVTSECPFGQDVSELASGVNILFLYLRVKIDPVGQPVKCHSVGSGNVSHRRTLAFEIIILITASLSSKVYNRALWRQRFAFGVT